MRDNDGWLCCVYIDRIFHYEKKERLNLMQDKMIKGSQLFCPSRFNCIVSLLLKKLIYNMNLFSLLFSFWNFKFIIQGIGANQWSIVRRLFY